MLPITPTEAAAGFGKFVDAIKSLPAWIFIAFAVASGLLLFAPTITSDLPQSFRPWLVISLVVFGVLAFFKLADVLIEFLWSARVASSARKTFHLTPITQHCHWSVAKQQDGSMLTQFVADFNVKNQSAAPVGLMGARIIKPKMKGEILHDVVTVRAQNSSMHGTAYVSNHRIAVGTALPARAVVMIRGKPSHDEEINLQVIFGITDEDGNEQRVRVSCRGIAKPKVGNQVVLIRESLQSISDPIEKDIAATLQSELSRYEKNGHQAGGLGSIHLLYRGVVMNQIGIDSWTMNSPKNQEIASDPEQAQLCSDNLDALLALHDRLTDDSQREGFINALLSRISESKGYVGVSYFIVCALWKLGFLGEALEQVLSGLPESDVKDYGLSNTLKLFNGLLRYRHPDFTSEMLDTIERFLLGTQENQFRIVQKIAAIRAHRLMHP